MITGQTDGVLRISMADETWLNTKPAELLAGLVLAVTECGHYSHKWPAGLEVRVLFKTLREEGSGE